MEVNVNINPSYANAYFKMNTNEFDTNIKFEVYCNNGLLENGHVSWYYNNYYSESFDLEIDIYGGSNATIPSVNTNNAQDLLANLYQ